MAQKFATVTTRRYVDATATLSNVIHGELSFWTVKILYSMCGCVDVWVGLGV